MKMIVKTIQLLHLIQNGTSHQDLEVKLEKLSKVNKIMDNLCERYGIKKVFIPNISIFGHQSVGKSTIISKIIGCAISKIGEGVVTRVPICFHLAPGDEFKITFDNTDYCKEKFNTFQQAFENKMRHQNIDGKKLHVNIVTPGAPCIQITDFPGSHGIEGKAHQIIVDHLENEGKYNLLLLVNSLYGTLDKQNDVARAISNQLGKDNEGNICAVESRKNEYVNQAIKQNKVLCIGTRMDCLNADTENANKRMWEQITDCEKSIRFSTMGNFYQ